jgi:tetratricopeptide (TPR) repeat protein
MPSGSCAVIADEIGDAVRRIAVQLPLGMAHHGLGDLAQAQRHFEQGVQMAEAQGNARSLLAALNGLAQLHRARGDVAQARPLYERVLQAARDVGDSSSTSIALLNLCMLPVDVQHHQEARSRLLEVLAMADVGQVAQSALEVCAGQSAREGHWAVAAELFGAAEAQALRSGLRRDAADEAFLAPLMDRTRAALGTEQYDRLEAGRRILPLTAALARARAWLQDAAGVNAAATTR